MASQQQQPQQQAKAKRGPKPKYVSGSLKPAPKQQQKQPKFDLKPHRPTARESGRARSQTTQETENISSSKREPPAYRNG